MKFALCLLLGACDLGYAPPCTSTSVTLAITGGATPHVSGRANGHVIALYDEGRVVEVDSDGAILSDEAHPFDLSDEIRERLHTASEGHYVGVTVLRLPAEIGGTIVQLDIDGAYSRDLPFGRNARLAGLRPIPAGVAVLWADELEAQVYRSLIRFADDTIDTRVVATYDRAWLNDGPTRFADAQDERALLLRTDDALMIEHLTLGITQGLPEPVSTIAWREERLGFASFASDGRVSVAKSTFGAPFPAPAHVARDVNPLRMALADDGFALLTADVSGFYALVFDTSGKKRGGDVPLGLAISANPGAFFAHDGVYVWVRAAQGQLLRSTITCSGASR